MIYGEMRKFDPRIYHENFVFMELWLYNNEFHTGWAACLDYFKSHCSH